MSGRRGGVRGTWLRGGKGVLASAGAAYLALLPLGALVVIPVAGTYASGADLLLALLLALGAVTILRSPGFRSTVGRGLSKGARTLLPGGSPAAAADTRARLAAEGDAGRVSAALIVLGAYALWAISSGAWGEHALYSAVKGAGYLALTVGAGVVLWCGLELERALDAWLLGALLVVVLSLSLGAVAVLLGAEGRLSWTSRVLYEGGSIAGLPGRRIRGPFLHPNGLGDYLVISGALLWARWPVLRSPSSPVSPMLLWAGALLLGVALVWTASSAWVALGVLLLLWGRRLPGLSSLLLRAGGGILAATTLAGLVFPLRIGIGDLQIVTSGIRPAIWIDATRAFLASPLVGVGAAPVLADAVDPLDVESGLQLWDAHNAYLGIAGQFGSIGLLLVGGAASLLVWALVRARRRGVAASGSPVLLERARSGVLGALVAVGVHGLVIAGEDFRHWWALVALAGLAVGGAWEWPEAEGEPGRPEQAT